MDIHYLLILLLISIDFLVTLIIGVATIDERLSSLDNQSNSYLCIVIQQIIDQKAPGITGQGHIVVHI